MKTRGGKTIAWEKRLRGVDHAILPPSTTRPNPVVAGNRLFAAIFAPGSICAVNRRTGELLWQTPLDTYAGSAVLPVNGTLFAVSCRTLYALAAENGAIRWEFTPHLDAGEWIYSQPAFGHGRVFIGVRCGDFYCLDASSGRILWRRTTSRDSNNQVNATALVAGSRVMTANNAGAVICYDISQGKTLWRRTVDGPCTSELLRAGSNVIITSDSVYALDMRTGTVRFELGFSARAFNAATIARRRVVAVLGPDFRLAGQTGPSNYEIVLIDGGREIARRPLRGLSAVRTCTDTGLVYCINAWSSEVIDPATAKALRSSRRRIALPDVSGGVLYTLTDNGLLSAEPSVVS